MTIEKAIAAKIVPALFKLPKRLSEMTWEQKQLVELTCIRVKIDPNQKRHVANTLEAASFPTALKLTNAATLGFWKDLGVKFQSDELWADLDNLYFIEDAELVDLSVYSYVPKVADPFRFCTDKYLEGKYIPLRLFKHASGVKHYAAGKSGTTKDFLGFEAAFTNNLYEGEMDYKYRGGISKNLPNELPDNLKEITYADIRLLKPQRFSELEPLYQEFIKLYGEPRRINKEYKIVKSGTEYIIYLPKANLQSVFPGCGQLNAIDHHFYDDVGLFQVAGAVPKLPIESKITRQAAAVLFAQTATELYHAIETGLDREMESIHVVFYHNIETVKKTLEKLEDEGLVENVGRMITRFKNTKPGKRIRGRAEADTDFSYPVEYVWKLKHGIYLKLP